MFFVCSSEFSSCEPNIFRLDVKQLKSINETCGAPLKRTTVLVVEFDPSSKHPIKPKTVKKVSMKVTNSPILGRRSKTVETRWFDSKPSRLHGNKLFKLCESHKLSRIPPHVSFWLCLFLQCYMLGCYESVQYL